MSDEDSFDMDRIDSLQDTAVLHDEDLYKRLTAGILRDMALTLKSVQKILLAHVGTCTDDRTQLNIRLENGRAQMTENTRRLSVVEERTKWLVLALYASAFVLGCVVTKMVERFF